jgi:hypothetical protein
MYKKLRGSEACHQFQYQRQNSAPAWHRDGFDFCGRTYSWWISHVYKFHLIYRMSNQDLNIPVRNILSNRSVRKLLQSSFPPFPVFDIHRIFTNNVLKWIGFSSKKMKQRQRRHPMNNKRLHRLVFVKLKNYLAEGTKCVERKTIYFSQQSIYRFTADTAVSNNYS